jgi:cyclomaltodextrinase / maltogenic alpha-amylase / neopullulanase
MTDDIFGNMTEPEQRLKLHLQNLDGVHHLYRRLPLDPVPQQPIQLFLTTGGSVPYDAARCSYTTNGSDPASPSASVLDLTPAGAEWDDISWSILRTWTCHLPPQPAGTLLRYRLAARRVDTGHWVEAESGLENAAPYFSLWVDDDPVPAWANSALVYQVFPDRFYPGNGHPWKKAKSLLDFYGGTLRGVTDKLDYIQSLGFNAIWLNPFFKTTSHHGYNASDYYTVEPRLGTNADLKELIEKAHAGGIRLILDFVANHWSKDHFTFQDAQKNPSSPYHDWYFWKAWPNDYECYFKVRELPRLNLDHPEARAYLLDVARHWLREGFDGYRLDFAYGPSHDFWVAFRRACCDIKPDCWIFGEVIHTAEFLRSYTGIMDGTLDFYLAHALRETFARETMSLTEFEAFLSAHEAFFPPEHIRPSFLDNHDEERFLHLAGDDKARLRLAALVHYTLAGPPIVYCGTETGLSQERPMHQNGHNIFEECRLPMNWETADAGLQDYYRRLNGLRQAYPVLQTGNRRVVQLQAEQDTYAYVRSDASTVVLVAINRSKRPQTISVANPGLRAATDRLNGNRVEVRGETLEIQLPPQSGAFVC